MAFPLLQLAKDMRPYEVRMMLHTPAWIAYTATTPLVWSSTPFSNLSVIPDETGVYSFVAHAGVADHPACNYLLYVGKAQKQTLKTRVSQYRRVNNRNSITLMLENWRDKLHVYFAPVANRALITDIENELLKALIPPFNTALPGNLGAVKNLF